MSNEPKITTLTSTPNEAAAAEAEAQRLAAEQAVADALKAKGDTPPAAEVAATTPKLEKGQKAILTAVYGRIINPFTLVEMEPGKLTPVASVDDWDIVQYNAGKIKLAEL